VNGRDQKLPAPYPRSGRTQAAEDVGRNPTPSESSSRSARFMIMAMGQRWGKPKRPCAAYRRRFADRQVEDIVHGEGPDGIRQAGE